MPVERVTSPKIKEPAGKYSHAMRAGNLLFISGQTGRDPDGTITIKGDVKAQARMALSRIQELCRAAGAGMSDILRLGVFVVNIADGDKVYEVYDEFFKGPPYPADTLIGNVRLAHPDFLVEIEAVVALPGR